MCNMTNPSLSPYCPTLRTLFCSWPWPLSEGPIHSPPALHLPPQEHETHSALSHSNAARQTTRAQRSGMHPLASSASAPPSPQRRAGGWVGRVLGGHCLRLYARGLRYQWGSQMIADVSIQTVKTHFNQSGSIEPAKHSTGTNEKR